MARDLQLLDKPPMGPTTPCEYCGCTWVYADSYLIKHLNDTSYTPRVRQQLVTHKLCGHCSRERK